MGGRNAEEGERSGKLFTKKSDKSYKRAHEENEKWLGSLDFEDKSKLAGSGFRPEGGKEAH